MILRHSFTCTQMNYPSSDQRIPKHGHEQYVYRTIERTGKMIVSRDIYAREAEERKVDCQVRRTCNGDC